ncbi:NAD(P)H-hydrate dehydratase, partial [Achromobacter xylosoxidans]
MNTPDSSFAGEIRRDDLPALFAARGPDTHKGSFGTVGVVGGGRGMEGAALLAARAALKTGAGKVLVGSP